MKIDKVKLFCDINSKKLQDNINKWLVENKGVDIKKVIQTVINNPLQPMIMYSIWYEEKNQS